MTDFQHVSKEEKEEWLRLPVTAAALAMLRELETMHVQGLLSETSSDGTSLHAVGIQAGKALGINQAINQLTRLK